jgi:hypothetical protein
MNVRKIIGRGLMGLGLFLMLMGTVSVPSTSWAAFVPADCRGTCNNCGTPSGVNCFRSEGGIDVHGSCTKNKGTCGTCTGKCSVQVVNQVDKCVCDVVP